MKVPKRLFCQDISRLMMMQAVSVVRIVNLRNSETDLTELSALPSEARCFRREEKVAAKNL